MISWVAVQDALSDWIASTSGLSGDTFEFDAKGVGLDTPRGFGTSSVFWAFQQGVQPRLPYAMLKLSPPRKIGALDELNLDTNLGRPAGTEIQYTVRGTREITLTVEVFSDIVTGNGTAMEFLEQALTSLRLPSVLSTLELAGLSLMDWEPPLELSAIVSTKYQSRAQADIKFYLVDTVVENDGYIAVAQTTGTIDTITYPEVDIPVA